MSKAVLISIRPEWCEKIASGQKTIEVRKTRPKIETPFKCYIYESHGDKEYYKTFHEKTIGKVIGEFVCDRIYRYSAEFARGKAHEEGMTITDDDMVKQSCLTPDELFRYENSGNNHRWGLLGWHISDLKIYDKPKELCQFVKPNAESVEELLANEILCDYCVETGRGEHAFSSSPNGPIMCEGRFCEKAYQRYFDDEGFTLYRPPQSWCYVEELA